MPNTKSAKKRLRQNDARRLHNRSVKSAMRTQLRHVREAIEAGEVEKAEEAYRQAAQRLDRAAARNIIHPNAAARTKSRIQKRIKAMKSPGSASETHAEPEAAGAS